MKRLIVDSDDNLVGSKTREELDLVKDIYRVSGLWITNSHGQALLAQRGLDNDDGAGEWGPAVAGTVQEGETYETNIYKEAEEEIGLKGAAFSLGPKQRISGTRNYFCQWFTTAVDKEVSSFTLQATEVAALQWVDETNLLQDIEANPGKYVPGMATAVKLLVSQLR
ncbi:MAG: NUDIX domain-containing protein [Candidatus Saccharibacteria bacterium]